MNPTNIVKVTNRSASTVMYKIPERHIRREFNRSETKEVPFQEVLDVCAQPGGRALFHNYLLVHSKEAIKEATNIEEEVEYYMTADQVKTWLPTCSLDELKDALDFAPTGVKDLIKKYAIELPLNDVEKRQALLDQLGFDVNKSIDIAKQTQSDEENATPQTRRVSKEDNNRRVTIIKKEDKPE